jgi:Strictosidine synthase
MADDLDIDPHGKIYFSDCTTRYEMTTNILGAIEGRPNGRVICYDPTTKKTRWVRLSRQILGPRHWQNFFWYKWLPITFGPNFGMMVLVIGRPDAAPFITGEVFHDGTLHLIRDVRVETAWDDNYYQTHVKADVRTDDELFVLEGQVLSLIPLRHVREVQGEIQNLRITEGMTLNRCNGHAALGMSEYCDLIAEGRPISIALGQ